MLDPLSPHCYVRNLSRPNVIVSLVLKKISNRNVYYKVKCIFGQVYL